MGRIMLIAISTMLYLAAAAQTDISIADSAIVAIPGQDGKGPTYKKVEKMPVYRSGEDRLYRYLNNLPYPLKAAVYQKEGTAYIRFVVNEVGKVVEISLAKSSGNTYLDADALKRVSKMRKWTPGYHHGQAVRVEYTKPLSYIL
jgi:protein TonB